MYKQKKINKDDVTMNKPETRERKQSAATCAPNKEKTLDLIKIHEIKIKNAVNKKGDEVKGIKVILKSNKAPIFQNMIIKHQEPEEETTPMILMVEDVIKVEDTELSITESGAEDWSETDSRWTDDTVPPTPALMEEIEEALSKDEKRSRLEQLRKARLIINSLQDELDERAEDEENKDTSMVH